MSQHPAVSSWPLVIVRRLGLGEAEAQLALERINEGILTRPAWAAAVAIRA